MAEKNRAGRLIGICGLAAMLLVPVGVVSSADAAVVIRRTNVYIATLPRGCVRTTYTNGIIVWKCGGIYYQPHRGRYVRVYVG